MELQERTQLVLKNQKAYFQSGETKKIKFKQQMLDKLFDAIKKFEPQIKDALYKDLRKSEFESIASEISGALEEIAFIRKKVRKWSKARRVPVAMTNHPASGRIYPEPYGSVLIFSAWNYPFLLMITPLAGAIAAGNCAVLKPAEQAPATAKVITDIIETTFDPDYITIFHGGQETAEALLTEKFDYIFFTGSSCIGKKVMKAASEHLTPVTLELGGKSPCIVDFDAKLDLAAKRIVWGKFLNAGQTCVAPDYLFVHQNVKDKLMIKMREYIRKFYGDNPQESPNYPRIINEKHFERLSSLLEKGRLVCGGEKDSADKYIAPTIIDQILPEDPIMQDEIFGPILPVMEFETIFEVIEFINARQKPLAMYYFSKGRKDVDTILKRTSAGGMCINETVTHLINPCMPFGGVGNSGMGAYHGKYSFDTFTHYKPVMTKSNLIDFPVRYPPFSTLKMKMLKFLTK
jgi:acyl-CoA reductase-like NAD-dependent aldehyde dehydrogenase